MLFRSYLYMKDDTLYKALYCGVCKSMGKNFGQISRISLTYDVAFLSAVVHNIKGVDVEIKKERCVAHAVIPRPMASRDEITSFCAAVNVVLAYHKIKDDVIDDGKGKIKLGFLKGAYKRANARYPEIAKIVRERYDLLRSYERAKEGSIDKVADAFALMLKDIGVSAIGKDYSESAGDFFYYLGKWIYLIDALDDYEKDIKKNNYNPFYYAFGDNRTIGGLLSENGKEISFIFADIFSSLNIAAKNVKWKFNHDLITNIITKGLPSTTMKIMKGENKKGKRSTLEEKK